MGIVKAAAASVSSMAADQWKEFFYYDAIPEDQIMVRAKKHASAQSANNGSQDIITDGSIIAVADGQCAIYLYRFDTAGGCCGRARGRFQKEV